MSTFFRFPHTPHLAWLGQGRPRDDKVFDRNEQTALLAGPVVVEEKLDGANLGISLAPDDTVRVQNRGQYLNPPFNGQFGRLPAWLAVKRPALIQNLGQHLILFGEWCAAKHSLDYGALPDWFLAFDVFDRNEQKFWSTKRRDELARTLGVCVVPALMTRATTLSALTDVVLKSVSQFRPGPLEGVVIRRETADWLTLRAKLVRPDFTQSITEHWSRRNLEWNAVQPQG